jgi:hypothetical protein
MRARSLRGASQGRRGKLSARASCKNLLAGGKKSICTITFEFWRVSAKSFFCRSVCNRFFIITRFMGTAGRMNANLILRPRAWRIVNGILCSARLLRKLAMCFTAQQAIPFAEMRHTTAS